MASAGPTTHTGGLCMQTRQRGNQEDGRRGVRGPGVSEAEDARDRESGEGGKGRAGGLRMTAI